jgi:hypothetical protein
LAILGPLRELDEVAYLRFASVYQGFESLEDFESAITLLRAEREATAREPGPPGLRTPPASAGVAGSYSQRDPATVGGGNKTDNSRTDGQGGQL